MRCCWWCRRRRCARSSRRSRLLVAAGTPLIVCAKGIEAGTHEFMSDVIAECAPKAVPAILSGPSFAADVARGLPTAVTLAARDEDVAAALAQRARLGDVPALPFDRPARRRDRRRGQERAGDRRRHRRRPRARRQRHRRADHARICRAGPLRPRLRRAAGDADRALGPRRPGADLLDARSRATFRSAHALGKGQTPDQVRAGAKLSEGAFTAPVLVEMARDKGVEMPICRCRRGDPRRHNERGRRHRRLADAPVPCGGLIR